MKKTVLLLLVSLMLSGCLSKDQAQKVITFWQQQFLEVFLETAAKNPEQARAMVKSPLYANGLAFQFKPGEAQPMEAAPQEGEADQSAPAVRRERPQVLDVTMDDKALPGQAPYVERVLMKQDWDKLQQNNQKTLQDLQTTFGDRIKEKAFFIMLATEQQLKKEASTAPTYDAYAARQKELEAAQEKALQTLMTKNKSSIRRIRR